MPGIGVAGTDGFGGGVADNVYLVKDGRGNNGGVYALVVEVLSIPQVPLLKDKNFGTFQLFPFPCKLK